MVAGVWVDDAMIRDDEEQQYDAERILAVRQWAGWSGLYFGGVAFTYQRAVSDVAGAARSATRFVDVVTTSGPATGIGGGPGRGSRPPRDLPDGIL